MFAAKLNASGSQIIWSTYLGGSGIDTSYEIEIDPQNNAICSGDTDSTNFPTTSGAVQRTYGGGLRDAFVVKINAAGTALVYSTYLGGSGDDGPLGLAHDRNGNAYVAGYTDSTNFPVVGAIQAAKKPGPLTDAFVTILNTTASSITFSTYLGGSGEDWAGDLDVDPAGNVYVGGLTRSLDFPVVAPFQATYGGGPDDTFVTKLDPNRGTILYSTYLVWAATTRIS